MSVRAAHYRNKAEECRIIAESTKDAEARRFLMTVVGDYIMLGDLVERLAVTNSPPASEWQMDLFRRAGRP